MSSFFTVFILKTLMRCAGDPPLVKLTSVDFDVRTLDFKTR